MMDMTITPKAIVLGVGLLAMIIAAISFFVIIVSKSGERVSEMTATDVMLKSGVIAMLLLVIGMNVE